MGREGHCKKYCCCVWGVFSVYGPHWVCPSSQHVFSGSTLLQLQGTLQGHTVHCPKWALHFMHFPGIGCSGSDFCVLCKGTDSVGHLFCTLPISEQFSRLGAWRVHCSRWAVHLNHLPCPATTFPPCAMRALSQVYRLSPLGSWAQAVTLLADANRPGSQEDLVSNWEPVHNVLKDASLRQRLPLAFWLWLSHLPLCLRQGMVQSAAG